MFEASQKPVSRRGLERELATLARDQERLTAALMSAGDVPAVVQRLRATEDRRCALLAQLEPQQATQAPRWREIERRVRQSLADWRSLLSGDVSEVRAGFRRLLTTPIALTPFVENGRRGVRWEGRIGLRAIFGGDMVTSLASPTGFGDRECCLLAVEGYADLRVA
jgi:hypothetical protein